ncbi:MAG: hypothetical protein WAO20_01865 [Acidobacteriota bacterium]
MLLKIAVGFAAAIAGLVSAGLLILLHAGVATVWVDSQDATFFVPVPVAAVDLALNFVPEEDLRDIQRDLSRFRPMIGVALEELRKCPDVTLVEVESPDEHVFVRKEGQDLKVDVRTRKGERFSVSVPLGGVEHVLAALSM